MKTKRMFSVWVSLLIAGCSIEAEDQAMREFPVQKTDAEWKEELTPEQYRILRQAGTERPFSGTYNDQEEPGTYHCVGCDAVLFASDSKFHSGCGWPAFDKAVADERVVERKDVSHGMIRTEVLCANCGGHLGHVFNDGPAATTGLRYCINSVALTFKKE